MLVSSVSLTPQKQNFEFSAVSGAAVNCESDYILIWSYAFHIFVQMSETAFLLALM